MLTSPSRRCALALASCLGAVSLPPAPAGAQTPPTVKVTSGLDSGAGTLRQAIDDAAPTTRITFDAATVTALDPVLTPLVVDEDFLQIDGRAVPGLSLGASDPLDTHLRLGDGLELTIIDIAQPQGVVELGGTLTYQTDNDTTLGVRIQDLDAVNAMTGTLVKTGAATLRLEGGPQLWTGGTAVQEGILVLGAGTSLDPDGDVMLEAPGTLRIETTGTTTFDGDLLGEGVLQPAADGSTLQLNAGLFTGTLDFAGDTITVVDDFGVVQGDVAFHASGGTLRLTSSSTLSGVVSGAGTVEIDADAADVVTLRGANTHSSTHVVMGTLVGDTTSLVNTVQNDDRLVIDQAANGTLSPSLSLLGAGSVTKTGTGIVTVGSDLAYTGTTTISGGGLDLQADLTGTTNSFTVGSAGTLSGFGDAVNADLDVSGVVAPSLPGDPIVVRSATFQPGSTLRFDVQAPGGVGSGDRLEASGSIDATDATPVLDVGSGDYSGGVDFVLLQAGAGMTVSAPTLPSSNLAFLTLTPNPGGTPANEFVVRIQGEVDDLPLFAATSNQLAVASDLETQFDLLKASPMPGSPLDAVLQAFSALDVDEVAPVLDAVSGEALSAFTTAHLATAQHFGRILQRRARGDAWGSRAALLGGERPAAAVDVGAAQALPAVGYTARLPGLFFAPAERDPMSLGVWAAPFGALGEVDGDGSSARVDHGLGGAVLGTDLRIAHGGMLGLAAGYGYADIDLSGRETTGTAHSAQAALYASWSDPLGYLSAAGRFSWARNHSERDIAIGQLAQTARADFDTLGFGAGAELGVSAARLGPVVLQPVASIDWTRLAQEAFDESGAGALNLDVERATTSSLQSGVGLALNARFELGERGEFVPELRGRWLHEYGDTDRVVRSRLEGSLTGGLVQVTGAETPRDAILAGIGWTTSLGEAAIAGDYDVVVDRDRLDHILSLTLRFAF